MERPDSPEWTEAKANALLADALGYRDYGISIIPIRHKSKSGKEPAIRSYTPYTNRIASEPTIRRWFGQNNINGIGGICGPVSGNLVIRDFDDKGSYQRWAEQQPELSRSLPTVQTADGFHVYFAGDIPAIQARTGNKGYKKCGDGELRFNGVYCLMPHSIHPNGKTTYLWKVQMPPGQLPVVNPFDAGLAVMQVNRTEQTEQTEHTEAIKGLSTDGKNSELDGKIASVIASTLPKRPGQRNHQIWQLARSLKAIYPTAEAKELKPILKEWHRLALPVITTKPFEETWLDFVTAWNNVQYPRGQEPIMQLLEQVEVIDMPEAAQDYEQGEIFGLIAICRELQRLAGDGPFFLGCRTAGRLLGVGHDTAARWLKLLVLDEILKEDEKGGLKEVEKGGKPRWEYKASRYRYIAEKEA